MEYFTTVYYRIEGKPNDLQYIYMTSIGRF